MPTYSPLPRLLPVVAVSLLSLSFATSRPASAAGPEEMTLWQGDAPMAGGQEPGDRPRLHLYRVQSDTPTAGIVILPGGGYGGLASDHEGVQIAEFFNKLGITAAICFYRHRGEGNAGTGYGHPVPMLDAGRAIRTLRANAKQWNIDPERIGVIGFSAGGHLASTVSTRFDDGDTAAADPIDRASSRPSFAILGYPVISFGAAHTHVGSQRNLIGPDADPELVRTLSNENAVTPQTPPTFLFHTAEDTAVPAENSLVYASALARAGVPVELHLFPSGPHGIGLAADRPGAGAWPRLCAQWLRGLKVLGE